jgi:hypothetical protein
MQGQDLRCVDITVADINTPCSDFAFANLSSKNLSGFYTTRAQGPKDSGDLR